MPLLNDPNHKDMIHSMRNRVPKILRLGTAEAPRAIVLVTAHWSEANPTISSGSKHKLLYDYYNFPKETYNLTYDAPGSPDVASEVEKALQSEGLKPEKDAFRGWDHGVFVPMLLINPSANVPIVQVSVMENESPEQHFAMGRALSKLRDQNIAIVGSGFASIHNLKVMFDGTISTPAFLGKNRQYSKELGEALAEESLEARQKRLSGWRKFTGTFEMHPRDHAEHFMPLLVCAAAGGDGKMQSYADDFMGLKVWSYYWE